MPHFHQLPRVLLALALTCAVAGCVATSAATGPVPPPKDDVALTSTPGSRTAVVAGGCFWGIQAVFQHVRGVRLAISGYAGGAANTARYEMVGSGRTGHAESVQISYDPSVVTYGQLLQVFFAVAHDPTELNRQGPDDGPQYRSAIFTSDDDQARVARAYIAQIFGRSIATTVGPLPAFYAAEDYHQNYATLHPYDPYIVINDAPKVAALRKLLPAIYVEPSSK
jgi:peptide-methionine (S)-S-oxide reductase